MSYEEIDKDDYKRNYTEDKQVDQNDLDGECCKQSAIFDYWMRLEKFAASEVDELETNLAALKSLIELEVKGLGVKEINKKYKLNLPESGAITDKIATNIRRQDKRVKEMIAKLNTAKHHYKISYAARMTFQTKKEMLDNLVKLHGQGYFSKVESNGYHERKAQSQREKLAAVMEENRRKSKDEKLTTRKDRVKA